MAPAPQTVGASGGALQRALLDALGEAVAIVVQSRGRAHEVAAHMARAARALASARVDELASVVGAELLQIARSRLGPEFGQAIADYIRELREGRSDTLAARVQAARDPSVVEMVLALAQEVAALGDGQVLLAVDAAERLSPDDLRMLADVARDVPTEVRVRVAFATYSLEQRRAVDQLAADTRAVTEVRVPGLDAVAVAEWICAEGLDEALAGRVLRISDGYPLLLADMVRQLRRGGEVEEADRNAEFARLTRLAWDQLDPEARRCARLLAVLDDPLPEQHLRALCGLDAAGWGDVVQRLERGMILSTKVNRVSWFHDQRRSVIRDFMGPAEIDDAAHAAIDELLAHINETGALERSGQLAALAAQSPTRQRADRKLAAAVELDGDELAVAAALLELTERNAVGRLAGGEVLRHARKLFGSGGDLIAALERVTAKQLAVTAEALGTVVVLPQFSVAAAAVIGGRAQTELGRLPVPAIGSLVFEVAISPRLQPFSEAHHGLGAPGMGLLSQWAAGRELSQFGPHYQRSEAELGHNLILRARYRDRPLVAAVRFANVEDRDAALSRLDGGAIDVLGERLSLETLTAHPLRIVAAGRFVRAAERVARRSFGGAVGLDGELNVRLRVPVSAGQIAQLKVDLTQLLAARCDSVERWAFGLDEPWGLHWYLHDDLLVEGEVRGGRAEAIRHTDIPTITGRDPFEFFRFEEAFGLADGETLAHLRVQAGRDVLSHDPVMQVIGRLRRRGEEFNASQAPCHLPLDADALRTALLDARTRELDDARALARAVPVGGERLADPEPQALYVLVAREEPAPGWVYGSRSSVTTNIAASTSGDEEVHVAVVPGDEDPGGTMFHATDRAFEDAFDRHRPRVPWNGHLLTIAARLLGHSVSFDRGLT